MNFALSAARGIMRGIRGSTTSAGVSATIKSLPNIPVRGTGFGTAISTAGFLYAGAAMSTSENPNYVGAGVGAFSAGAIGLGLAFGAPAAVRGAVSKFGTRQGFKASPLARKIGSNFVNTNSFVIPPTPLNSRPFGITPVNRPTYTPKGGKWDPKMVRSMTQGMAFSKRLSSQGGQQLLFGTGAMLSGNLFNTAYITGNNKNHGYTDQSGNRLR